MFEFLDKENRSTAQEIYSKYKSEYDDIDFVRFWSEKEIQLDGNFSLEELKMFVEMMEAITK